MVPFKTIYVAVQGEKRVVICFGKIVLQRHEKNIKGCNQLVEKFAEEYHFPGNIALFRVALRLETF